MLGVFCACFVCVRVLSAVCVLFVCFMCVVCVRRRQEVGSCGGVYMDALAGKWTCELECMTGFVKTAGAVISCGPNGDEPWGKLSGSITCQGIFVVCRKLQHMSRVTGTNAMCSPLSHLVRFLFVLPPIFLNPTWQGYHVVLSSCQILVTRMVTTKTTKLLTRSVCALCVFYVCFVCVCARACVCTFVCACAL